MLVPVNQSPQNYISYLFPSLSKFSFQITQHAPDVIEISCRICWKKREWRGWHTLCTKHTQPVVHISGIDYLLPPFCPKSHLGRRDTGPKGDCCWKVTSQTWGHSLGIWPALEPDMMLAFPTILSGCFCRKCLIYLVLFHHVWKRGCTNMSNYTKLLNEEILYLSHIRASVCVTVTFCSIEKVRFVLTYYILLLYEWENWNPH